MKRIPWKLLAVSLIIIFVITISCDRSNPSFEGDSLIGRWETTAGGEKIVFIIESNGNSGYRGVVATFHNNIKLTETKLGAIHYANLHLNMLTNPKRNITYEGKLDTVHQIIDGRLLYSSGKEYPLKLQRLPGKEFQIMKSTKRKLTPGKKIQVRAPNRTQNLELTISEPVSADLVVP